MAGSATEKSLQRMPKMCTCTDDKLLNSPDCEIYAIRSIFYAINCNLWCAEKKEGTSDSNERKK